jgi:hypothetical protein
MDTVKKSGDVDSVHKHVYDPKKDTAIPVVKQAKMGPGVVMSTTATPWVSEKPYPKGAVVSLDGQTFKSKKDKNLSTPSTSGADWALVK